MPSRTGRCPTPASTWSPFVPLDSIDPPRRERPPRTMLRRPSALLLHHHPYRHRPRPRPRTMPFDDRPPDGPPTETTAGLVRLDRPERGPRRIASRSSNPVRPTRLVRASFTACLGKHRRRPAFEGLRSGLDRVRIDRRPCRRRVTLVRKPSRHHHPRFLDRRRCRREV